MFVFSIEITVVFPAPLRREFNRDLYLDAIEVLPLTNTPNVFGLHANAEIGYYTSAAKGNFKKTVKLQDVAFLIKKFSSAFWFVFYLLQLFS